MFACKLKTFATAKLKCNPLFPVVYAHIPVDLLFNTFNLTKYLSDINSTIQQAITKHRT